MNRLYMMRRKRIEELMIHSTETILLEKSMEKTDMYY